MLEKLITDLKNSLPEALRKKLGGADNSDDEQEFEEVETGPSESAAESSDEEKKKKMKSMIIKVIVILGLGYFALDEFVLKGMQQESETDIFAQAPKPKRKKPAEAEVVTTNETPPTDTSVSSETPPVEPATDTSTVSSSTEETATPSVNNELSETPPIENINVLEKTTESTPAQAEHTEPVAEVVEQPPVQPEEQVISESRVGESSADQKLDQLVENVEQTAPTNPIEEVKIPSSNETISSPSSSSSSMASKIVEGVTETAPPAYDQVGRGLVYNCKDKYWACLDKPAYVTCNKNQKWNQSKGNAIECAVADIYSSDEDCAKVQKYNVSTNAPTAFCKN